MTSKPVAPSRFRRIFRRCTHIALFLLVLWMTLSYVVAHRLTSRPVPMVSESLNRPQDANVESFRLTTQDGVNVGAWFFPGNANQPIVMILHGHGGYRTGCLPHADFVRSTGSPVMMLSFRSHGDSEGNYTDFGYSGRFEVLAAMNWLEQRFPGRPVVLWGISMGSAASLFASEELGDRVIGYILDCPYRDLRSATRNRTRMYLPPVLEYVMYVGLTIVSPLRISNIDAISPVDAAVHVPASADVLILAGEVDLRATPDDARAIKNVLGDKAKLVIIPGGDHAKLVQADSELYYGEIRRLLEACAKRTSK